MATDLFHHARALFYASIERREEAWLVHGQGHFVLATYLGGLAIESLLEAIVLKDGGSHDARHDLMIWLRKCPSGLQGAIKAPPAAAAWERVVTLWDNRLRYLDRDAFLGYLRHSRALHRFSGDNHARMLQCTKAFLQAVDTVHGKGLLEWQRDKTS